MALRPTARWDYAGHGDVDFMLSGRQCEYVASLRKVSCTGLARFARLGPAL
jgi:hypothetical protein